MMIMRLKIFHPATTSVPDEIVEESDNPPPYDGVAIIVNNMNDGINNDIDCTERRCVVCYRMRNLSGRQCA